MYCLCSSNGALYCYGTDDLSAKCLTCRISGEQNVGIFASLRKKATPQDNLDSWVSWKKARMKC